MQPSWKSLPVSSKVKYEPIVPTCIYTYNPAIPLLREMKVHVHTKTCTWMFTVALFIIVYNWNPPKCLSTDEEINCGISIQWNITRQKTKWTIDRCNMKESQKHAHWKKPEYKLFGSIYIKFRTCKLVYSNRKQISGCLVMRVGITKRLEETLGVMNILSCFGDDFTGACIYQNLLNCTLYICAVTACQLYFDKAVEENNGAGKSGYSFGEKAGFLTHII